MGWQVCSGRGLIGVDHDRGVWDTLVRGSDRGMSSQVASSRFWWQFQRKGPPRSLRRAAPCLTWRLGRDPMPIYPSRKGRLPRLRVSHSFYSSAPHYYIIYNRCVHEKLNRLIRILDLATALGKTSSVMQYHETPTEAKIWWTCKKEWDHGILRDILKQGSRGFTWLLSGHV